MSRRRSYDSLYGEEYLVEELIVCDNLRNSIDVLLSLDIDTWIVDPAPYPFSKWAGEWDWDIQWKIKEVRYIGESPDGKYPVKPTAVDVDPATDSSIVKWLTPTIQCYIRERGEDIMEDLFPEPVNYNEP